ncbi:MerR family transcriptional regulator [Nocardia aurantiaca]|uniref:MerR family transcriptional regulator n=1 Tax=Nocardia aurantiaca TaxID=2675850 RepID=A0A6I3L8V2_9NOCA|nr:MerR family transcriptional regulator [Nocardia aurantiaca]
MRIGALARATGVNERLLRYYEDRGLLRPIRRSNGYRYYTESDITTVAHIRSLLAAGLSTAVIARILHCIHGDGEELSPSPCPGMITQLRREHARIDHTITRLQAARQTLDALIDDAVDPSRAGDVARQRNNQG